MVRSAMILTALALATFAGVSGDATPDRTPSANSAGKVGGTDLRDELLTMMAQDQAERSSESSVWHDQERTVRLREIIAEHGWPGFDLVGTDGATAAWVIAQHSDHDPAFQQQALTLMRTAVQAGQADPTELAYLEDRVAVNTGGEQTYGTQLGECVDGTIQPAPLADPATVDQRRAETSRHGEHLIAGAPAPLFGEEEVPVGEVAGMALRR